MVCDECMCEYCTLLWNCWEEELAIYPELWTSNRRIQLAPIDYCVMLARCDKARLVDEDYLVRCEE